jgi:hypothetical protein
MLLLLYMLFTNANLRVAVLLPTHAAIQALRLAMVALGGVLDASTINSWLNIGLERDIGAMMASIARRSEQSGAKFQPADVIIIDEISMLHSNTWSLLGIYKRYHPNTVFILSGDFNQLAAVSSGLSGVRHEFAGNKFSDPNIYTHTDMIHQLLACPFSGKPGTEWVLRHSMRAALCPNLRALSSDPYSVYRIDPQQYNPDRFGFDMVGLTYRNICFTNACRDRVCQMAADQ